MHPLFRSKFRLLSLVSLMLLAQCCCCIIPVRWRMQQNNPPGVEQTLIEQSSRIQPVIFKVQHSILLFR